MFLLSQISDFTSAKADFGTDLAISTRAELDPGESHYVALFFEYFNEQASSHLCLDGVNMLHCVNNVWLQQRHGGNNMV